MHFILSLTFNFDFLPLSQPTATTCTPTQNLYPPTNIHIFYTDWSAEGFDQGCLNDRKEPAYMLANPSAWLQSTLSKCCETNFTWNYETCMRLLDESYARELWYPDWERANTGCVSDGNEPLYMIEPVNKHLYLFNTRKDCIVTSIIHGISMNA